MKIRYFILSALISQVFVSCSLKGGAEATPQFGIFAIYTTAGDTLRSNYYGVLDTIYVGDTVVFKMGASGMYHKLTELQISLYEKTTAKLVWPEKEELDSVYASYKTDSVSGKFQMHDTMFQNFHFQLVGLSKTDEQKITFGVLSEASRDYNSKTAFLIVPVKPKAAVSAE